MQLHMGPACGSRTCTTSHRYLSPVTHRNLASCPSLQTCSPFALTRALQAMASSQPPPRQAPSTAATVGLGPFSSRAPISLSASSRVSRMEDICGVPNSVKSKPAQNLSTEWDGEGRGQRAGEGGGEAGVSWAQLTWRSNCIMPPCHAVSSQHQQWGWR